MNQECRRMYTFGLQMKLDSISVEKKIVIVFVKLECQAKFKMSSLTHNVAHMRTQKTRMYKDETIHTNLYMQKIQP